MKDANQISTVTNERPVAIRGGTTWSVSVKTGSDMDGAKLSVARHFNGDMPGTDDGEHGSHVGYAPNDDYGMVRGDHDGKMFETSEAAWQFALERGYIREYHG